MKKFLKRAELPAFFAVVTLAAVYLRYLNLPFESADYRYFLSQWYIAIEQGGGFAAMGQVISNYSPPYMYLMALMTYLPISDLVAIKLFSCLFDLLLAVYAGRIVLHLTSSRTTALMCYTATLFLPAVFLNSSVWGQCDAIYVAFLIMSLYYLLKGGSIGTMLCFGLAFSFKLQAIFFLPVLILAILKKKLRVWSPAVALGVFLLSGLPAVIAGMSLKDAYGVYLLQANYYEQLSMIAPNLYLWMPRLMTYASYRGFSTSMICFAFGAVGAAMLPLYRRAYNTEDPKLWLTMAAFFAAFMPYVLPHMHERYWYFSDILALLLIFVMPRLWKVSLALMIPSFYAICIYLFDTPKETLPYFALLMLLGIAWLGKELYDLVKAPSQPSKEALSPAEDNAGEPAAGSQNDAYTEPKES